MIIDKNYFLGRLNSGESIDTIGEDIANMMNAAMNDYKAEQEAAKAKAAAAEKDEAKRALAEELIEIIQEFAILEGEDPDDFVVSEEDVQAIIDSITAMFKTLAQIKQLTATLNVKPTSVEIKPATKKPKSDDEVLANFIANLM
jgi:hypothetical protein